MNSSTSYKAASGQRRLVADLIGTPLDLAVAMAEGIKVLRTEPDDPSDYVVAPKQVGLPPWAGPYAQFTPSSLWLQGGPIIEREGIAIIPVLDGWAALIPDADDPLSAAQVMPQGMGRHYVDLADPTVHGRGPTPLVAAMRAYVVAKLGAEVEL